jgi:hypothetical protein
MKTKIFFAVAFFYFCSFNNAMADVFFSEDAKQIRIAIEGQITPGDELSLMEAIKSADASFDRSPRLYFYSLNSNGGDLETALKMGRLIRTANYHYVGVGPRSACLSSCVLILAAGKFRDVSGKVGIHRIYFVDDKATTSDSQKEQYRGLEASVRQFLSDVNIAPSLYDDMQRISPTKIKYLSASELDRYGLNRDDPYADSAKIARIAASLKITSGEYIKRAQRAEQECSAIQGRDARISCAGRILGGK